MTSSRPTELSESDSVVTDNKVSLTVEMGVSSTNSIPASPRSNALLKAQKGVSDKNSTPAFPKAALKFATEFSSNPASSISSTALANEIEVSNKNSVPDLSTLKATLKFGSGVTSNNSIRTLLNPRVALANEIEASDKNLVPHLPTPRGASKLETGVTSKNSIRTLPNPRVALTNKIENSTPDLSTPKTASKFETGVTSKNSIRTLPNPRVALTNKIENSTSDLSTPKAASKFETGVTSKNSIRTLPNPRVALTNEIEDSNKNSTPDSSMLKVASKLETGVTSKNSIQTLPNPRVASTNEIEDSKKDLTPDLSTPKAASKFETGVTSKSSIRSLPKPRVALKVEIGVSGKNSIPGSPKPKVASTAEIKVLNNDSTPASPVEIRSTPRFHQPRVKSFQMGWAQVVEELSWKLSTMETSGGSESSGGEDAEARRARRGHVLAELMQTERVYVQELGSILSGYKEEIEKPENQHLLPAALVGQADVLFGNLHELFTFHQDVFLKDLEKSISATELVALCFVEKRDTFFRLYSYYCQNIPRSERLRETLVDTHLFLQACQLRLGHKLPLAAYLLKPVQRITKYQLLLKDLLRYGECGSMTTGLQSALDCMLVVLKCVNDSMHQIAITGVPLDISQQGELLMQGSFLVVSENKRDIRLRIRPRRRHIFLYEKAMLFCKPATKNSHNKATYHFKHDLQMSQIGLTESVKGDVRKFEVWRQGRSEVHTLTAASADVKRAWVERVKRVLLDQLNELKGERVRQYSAQHRTLIQTSSWELGPPAALPVKAAALPAPARAASCDTHDEPCWSTDPSDDDDDEPDHPPAVGCALVALSDYTAVGPSEVSLREGQHAELLKVGCAGWWYVRLAGGQGEGWAPAAYLDQRKTSRSSSRSHDRLHEH